MHIPSCVIKDLKFNPADTIETNFETEIAKFTRSVKNESRIYISEFEDIIIKPRLKI